jgi:DNA-binding beta-propeller fold protein YncE
MVKEFLSRAGVPYEVRLLTDPAIRSEIAQHRTGKGPITLIGDQAVGGYDRTALRDALSRAGLIQPQAADAFAAPSAPTTDFSVPIGRAVIVSTFIGDRITYLDPARGTCLGSDLDHSSIPLTGRPIASAASVPSETIAVANHEAASVTFLSLESGTYLRGDLRGSTLETEAYPLHVVAHPARPLFYVSNLEGQSISVFDASGAHAFGSRERSTFTVPGHPNTLALDAARGILFARLRERAIALLDADTLQPLRGTWERSTLPCGEGRDLALSGSGERLFAPQSLGSADGLVAYDVPKLAPLHGSYEASVLSTGPVPFAIAAHPSREILYVASFGRNAIEYRDARTGHYLNGTPEASSFRVPSGARSMCVDASTDTLFVSCFDADAVIMLDARSGAPRGGDLASASIPVGRGPRGVTSFLSDTYADAVH